MLVAVAEIVLEVVALIFQCIERLVFDAPTGSGPLHEPVNRALVQPQVGDPAEVLGFAFGRFPALYEVDAQCGVGGIEGPITDKAKAMVDALFGVVTLVIGDAASLLGLCDLLEQKRMVTFFDAQQVMDVMAL